jgi:5-methylcytosine-specific restriction endonuclease McrA
MSLCDYGCGNKGKYKQSSGKLCCSKNFQSCPAVRQKNSKGLKKAYKEGRKDLSHFDGKRGWKKNKMLIDPSKYFCKESKYATNQIRTFVIRHELIEYCCSKCGISDWCGEKISLELHHINGDNSDHRLENLTFLCPNCHSQTENWRGKSNLNKSGQKVSDDELLNIIPKSSSIRQVCIKAGISGRGGNHPRIRKLIRQSDVNLSSE